MKITNSYKSVSIRLSIKHQFTVIYATFNRNV